MIPLLSTVSELSRQKRELVGIIKRKDLEIQNYKEEGASLSRRELFSKHRNLTSTTFTLGHLKTEPFDEKAFDNEMTVSEVKDTYKHTKMCTNVQCLYLF